MTGHYPEFALQRSVSCRANSSRKIIPASGFHARSPSSLSASAGIIPSIPEHEEFSHNRLLVPCPRCSSGTRGRASASSSSSSPALQTLGKFQFKLSSLIRSLMNIINIPTCKFLSLPAAPSSAGQLISLATGGGGPSLGRRVTGTLYGHRRGHVTFAVQYDPRSDPVLLLDLAMSTATLVKEMSSGLVRIALECEKRPSVAVNRRPVKLFQEPVWTMYCNGRKCGYTVSRVTCNESDCRVLNTVSRVSVGAGVIPTDKICAGDGGGVADLGELLYMRGRFERVVGSRDSEAFYMLNPDKNGGPELSIFLLRI